jgi:hypothetical protein
LNCSCSGTATSISVVTGGNLIKAAAVNSLYSFAKNKPLRVNEDDFNLNWPI